MADNSKKTRKRRDLDSPGGDDLNLSENEVEVSLICLRYFRGDWDMYLDYLQGSRVTPEQRRRDLPLVEQLRDRDRRTEYLTTFLEDELAALAQHLGFDGLIKIWEHALELDPQSEPFADFKGGAEPAEAGESVDETPPTLH